MPSRISRVLQTLTAGIAVCGMADMARGAFIVNGDVTAPGDPIVGVAATPGSATSVASTAGGGSGNAFPTAEAPSNAIDNVVTAASKYLNFQQSNAGFITSILANGPQAIVFGMHFETGNDAPERDPVTIVLEGTNNTNPTTTLNSTWTQIYSGVTGLATDPGRNAFGPTVNFTNTLPFSSYRVLITTVRTPTSANSFQFGEVELIGNTVPEPTSIGLIAVAGLGLLARRRGRASA